MASNWNFLLAAALLAACSSPGTGNSVTAATTGTQEGLPDIPAVADADSASDVQADDSLLDKPDTPGDSVPAGDVGVDALGLPDAASSVDVATAVDGQDTGYEKPGPDAQQPEADVIIVPPAPPVLEGCKDVRQKHDNKVFWDNCWEPPHHYCSDGSDAAVIWIGCKPGTLVCCQFPSSCIPCGWLHCSPTSGMSSEQQQKCVETAKLWETVADFPEECKPYMPNYNPICWDGVDPSWGDKAAHWMLDNAAWLNW